MATRSDPLPLDVTHRVNVGTPGLENVALYLAGCGGTGSFLALHLARLAYHAGQRGVSFHLVFVDPDRVEEKNVGRQNFVPAEVGRFKAEALAVRYSLAFGLSIRFFAGAFHPDHVDGRHRRRDGWLHLVVGAVDTAAARRDIEAVVRGWSGRLWWLDCGNHDHSGQVLLGNRGHLQAPEISPLGFCTGLPLPSVQCPELVGPEEAGVSCAEAALTDAQSLMVNQAAAGWAASYVHRLVAGDLDAYATYFDLRAGSARSEYVVNGRA